MNERGRKILDTRILEGKRKRELLTREIQQPDGVWIRNWLGWNYMFIQNEWIITPDAPLFQSQKAGEEWLKSNW